MRYLRAVPDPEERREVGTSDSFETKRTLIRHSILGMCEILDEILGFALKEEFMNAKERIFHLNMSADQSAPGTRRIF